MNSYVCKMTRSDGAFWLQVNADTPADAMQAANARFETHGYTCALVRVAPVVTAPTEVLPDEQTIPVLDNGGE